MSLEGERVAILVEDDDRMPELWYPCSRVQEATRFSSARDDLEAAGARWSDEPGVVAGNLITSGVPGDLPAFCEAVIAAPSRTPATGRVTA